MGPAASASLRLFGAGAAGSASAPTPAYDPSSMATPSTLHGAGVATPALGGTKGGLGQVFGWMEGMKGARGAPWTAKVGRKPGKGEHRWLVQLSELDHRHGFCWKERGTL